MLQLYTANFLYGYNLFKMVVMFLFSQLDGPNAFFPPNSTDLALTSEKKENARHLYYITDMDLWCG